MIKQQIKTYVLLLTALSIKFLIDETFRKAEYLHLLTLSTYAAVFEFQFAPIT